MPSALIVWGGWEGHRPRDCARWAESLLCAEGFEVGLADTLAVFDDEEGIAAHDLVIPCWTMGSLTAEQERSLTGAVARGTGIAGWHGGMGDAFRPNTQYQFMVGGQFVAHPGDIRRYVVNVAATDDAIAAGLDDFEVSSEQYYMHVDPGNRVLATTTFDGAVAPWVLGCVMPVAWTKRWGEGRVFYCSIGHAPEDLENPPVRELLRRGMVWAAGVRFPRR
jgi:uncharacterized protein